MGGALRKVGVYLGLVEDQDRFDDDAIYDDDFETEHDVRDTRTEQPPQRPAPAPIEDDPVVTPRERERERGGGTVAPFPERRQVRAAPEPVEAGRITTLHPRTYNDARLIGEHFRDGTPVIMNLTDMDDADAKRLVDFAAGLIFGLRGSIDRVTARVFLLSPANVTVRAEEKARMAAEGGFFNQS